MAAAYAAGLALWRDVSDSPLILTGLSVAVWLAGILVLRWSWTRATLALALAGFFLLGGAAIRFEQLSVPASRVDLIAPAKLDLRYAVRVRGWVRSHPYHSSGTINFELETEQVEQGSRVFAVSGGVAVRYYLAADDPAFEKLPGLAYGDRIEALLILRPLRSFRNRGVPDRVARLRRQEIYLGATLRSGLLVKRLAGEPGNPVRRLALRLRVGFQERLDQLLPPGRVRAVLSAMLLGERGLLRPNLREKFRRSGAYHVLVISGLHVMLLAGTLFYLFRLVGARDWLITLVTILVLVVYLFMVDDRPPTERAVWMASLFMLSRLFYRNVHVANPAGLAALLMLFLHPLWLFDGSFHFTFSAVLLIAFLAVPWIQQTTEPHRNALGFLASEPHDDHMANPRLAQFRLDLRALGTSLAPICFWSKEKETSAQWILTAMVRLVLRTGDFLLLSAAIHIGFLILIPFHFHQMIWAGFIGSLLAVPLVTVIVPLGMAALTLPFVSVSAAAVVAVLTGALLLLVDWLSELPLTYFLPPPPVWMLYLYLVAVGLLAFATHRRKGIVPALALLAPLVVLVATHPFPAKTAPGTLEVTFLDVGQGDSIVVHFPNGERWLIDGGAGPRPLAGGAGDGFDEPDPELRGVDIGRTVVGHTLRARGIRRLDRVWLSHSHHDHSAGLERVLEEFEIGTLEMGWPSRLKSRRNRLHTLAKVKGIPVRYHTAGENFSVGDAQVEILWPAKSYQPPEKQRNDDSLVLRICWKGRCILLPGDIEAGVERRLAATSGRLRAQVMKVPHHGGIGSATGEFLDAVQPRIAVASASGGGPHGHPRADTLGRLTRASAQVYRTDRDGSVTIVFTDEDISVSTYEERRVRVPMRDIGEKFRSWSRTLLHD